MVMSYFQGIRPEEKVECFHTTGTQRKVDAYTVVGFCGRGNTVFEAIGCYYQFCPCQKYCPSLTEEEFLRGIKRRELDETRKQYIQQTGATVMVIYECV